jgi:hypothetical protein
MVSLFHVRFGVKIVISWTKFFGEHSSAHPIIAKEYINKLKDGKKLSVGKSGIN